MVFLQRYGGSRNIAAISKKGKTKGRQIEGTLILTYTCTHTHMVINIYSCLYILYLHTLIHTHKQVKMMDILIWSTMRMMMLIRWGFLSEKEMMITMTMIMIMENKSIWTREYLLFNHRHYHYHHHPSDSLDYHLTQINV